MIRLHLNKLHEVRYLKAAPRRINALLVPVRSDSVLSLLSFSTEKVKYFVGRGTPADGHPLHDYKGQGHSAKIAYSAN